MSAPGTGIEKVHAAAAFRAEYEKKKKVANALGKTLPKVRSAARRGVPATRHARRGAKERRGAAPALTHALRRLQASGATVSNGGFHGVAAKSPMSFRFLFLKDHKLEFFFTSPVPSVAAQARDQFYRAAGAVPRGGHFNFEDDAEADEAVEYEKKEMLTAGLIQYCSNANCGRLIKKVKKAGAKCEECKEPRVEKLKHVRYKEKTGRWEATVGLGQRRNKYVGTFVTQEEAGEASDAYIRANGLDKELNYATPEAGADAAKAARAAFDKAEEAKKDEAPKAPEAKRAKTDKAAAAAALAAAGGAGADDGSDDDGSDAE